MGLTIYVEQIFGVFWPLPPYWYTNVDIVITPINNYIDILKTPPYMVVTMHVDTL